ncbi:prephenate/arogenate dehydrogenase family protein [Acidocella aminolytica]|jgi:cyclohexadieny/prephenate dehydrogenase|uniref:prephenate dehydrogenase n=1 Tax=Acidocella aminolytica 101 = DSM 11237 TaxID=1120923 RepID=A0A0D6PFL9_9PROT|nr:prephenate/arogenate dehydrogenase family protein [Acidocella aminolytica]GAN80141.1 cyclohexadienyl/arogenate/prephenate dehydrogenase [Acidocella aminolytica 101 = DSM 11237]GBQ38116.1 cyclohexadienyl/arogenate/prephenate dehydrogenase [Acidocella aminolytica 101 = DSM 11237]SHE87709.1 cyclohexadieny/prephenate dehydrogenase [Acidocella aminolytica 101 = DSM 11237]
MAEPLFNRLVLIGIGHIGASIAGALKLHPGTVEQLVISDTNPDHLQRARELGLGDDYVADATAAVTNADGVILCTPVGSFAGIAEAIAPHLAPGSILSDVGSTKQSVIRDVLPFVPKGVSFVPAHPMAGTEFSGPDAGVADLFEGRWCLLTPIEGVDETATRKIEQFWQTLGARTARMGAAHHDRVLAIVSHLPHLIAFTICGTADDLADETREEVLEFAATGFRDFTRIAASDPVMWRDVFVNNKDALLEMFSRFSEDAQAMARAVRWGDTDYIEDKIKRSRKIRKTLIDIKQA